MRSKSTHDKTKDGKTVNRRKDFVSALFIFSSLLKLIKISKVVAYSAYKKGIYMSPNSILQRMLFGDGNSVTVVCFRDFSSVPQERKWIAKKKVNDLHRRLKNNHK
jgi:hypothetical protein